MNKKLWILFLVAFLDLLGFGVVIPILPNMIVNQGGNTFVVGIVIALFSIFQFISSTILGRLSDKYGRKRILIISTFITSLSYFLIFLSQSLWILILGRILAGIGSANISVVQAYLADVSKGHERTKLLAYFSAIFSLGFIIGPFIGGFLAADISYNAPFLFMGVLSFINAILIALFIKESNKSLQKHIKIEFINLKVTKELLQPKNMAFLYGLFFLINFSFALTIGVFPLFSGEIFGWSEKEVGYYFAFGGIIGFFMQTIGIKYFLKRINETQLIKIGLLLFGISFIGIGLSQTLFQLLAVSAISSIGFSVLAPTIQALISLESNEEEQGLALGTAQSFGALSRIAGPLIGGIVATFHINYPYILSGAVTLAALAIGQKYLKESFIRQAQQKNP